MLALALVLAATGVRAQVPVTEISQFNVERTEEGVLLSASINVELPPIIDDALQKGIPMFFVAEAAIYRERWYWADKQVTGVARHMRLSYQPLTRRWRLMVSPTPIGSSGLALGQNFESHDDALAAVRRVSNWKIAEPTELEADGRYNVVFRFRLDVSQLPRPFQIGAVGQSDWNIAAGRTQRLPAEGVR